MTNQEAFNKAVEGLASQGFKKSQVEKADPEGGVACAYTSKVEGKVRHCAAGWLLPEWVLQEIERNPRLNTVGWQSLEREAPTGLRVNPDFIKELQYAHDVSYGPVNMIILLMDVAHKNGLTLPPVLNATLRTLNKEEGR
jgi:hypothetical protein